MKNLSIKQLANALQVFRTVNPDMNINMLLTFLEVAQNDGITGRELEDRLALPHTTAARMMRYFDRLQTAGKPGLDLFKVELDPLDYKAKLRKLNDNGAALLNRVEEAMSN